MPENVKLVEPVSDQCEFHEIGRAIRSTAHQNLRQLHHFVSEGKAALCPHADDLLDGVERNSIRQMSQLFVASNLAMPRSMEQEKVKAWNEGNGTIQFRLVKREASKFA